MRCPHCKSGILDHTWPITLPSTRSTSAIGRLSLTGSPEISPRFTRIWTGFEYKRRIFENCTRGRQVSARISGPHDKGMVLNDFNRSARCSFHLDYALRLSCAPPAAVASPDQDRLRFFSASLYVIGFVVPAVHRILCMIRHQQVSG